MIWSALGVLLSLTVLTGAMLGAALGLTGFAILHFFGGGSMRLGVQAVFKIGRASCRERVLRLV